MLPRHDVHVMIHVDGAAAGKSYGIPYDFIGNIGMMH
jgi:hypothetical protein